MVGHSQLPMPTEEVERGKISRAAEDVQCILDVWEGILVGNGVDSPVVHTKMEGPVFFDSVDWGRP